MVFWKPLRTKHHILHSTILQGMIFSLVKIWAIPAYFYAQIKKISVNTRMFYRSPFSFKKVRFLWKNTKYVTSHRGSAWRAARVQLFISVTPTMT
jgi:hypothetical protein